MSITFEEKPEFWLDKDPVNSIRELELAYRCGNAGSFIQGVDSIDWTKRSVKEFRRVVRLALQFDLHQEARRLAELGGKQFPGDAEMQKIAAILAPSRVIETHLPPDPDAKADMVWLKEHAQEYRGRWVALKAGALLASADDYKTLLRFLEEPIAKKILITPVY